MCIVQQILKQLITRRKRSLGACVEPAVSSNTPNNGHYIARRSANPAEGTRKDLGAPSHPTPRLSFKGRDVQLAPISTDGWIHLEFSQTRERQKKHEKRGRKATTTTSIITSIRTRTRATTSSINSTSQFAAKQPSPRRQAREASETHH